MTIVADTIADTVDLLIGVDTHAAGHTFALINAATGALADTQDFPTSPAGLRRALAWIQRRTDAQTVLVVIDASRLLRCGPDRAARHRRVPGRRGSRCPSARAPSSR